MVGDGGGSAAVEPMAEVNGDATGISEAGSVIGAAAAAVEDNDDKDGSFEKVSHVRRSSCSL